ncbi:hypothetical protein PR202_gb26337 [Eleusine coracana subsp. coracana]|uniref:Leucine-rich repeat-containing N-terminal plant-type domain-containing protein n=1 Tax=Eleusine coracana subsp. coracana TaxID=191504 RepID=A0AAV5FS98_ELECO|nr:hypothetical protein PR202_gb26337 [Eleusine coracana subsp. coracana]
MLSSITSHPDSLVLHLLVSFLYYLGTQRSLSLGSYNNQTNVPIPCLPEQASALLRLKSSFSTSGWADGSICSLASWRAHTDCCDWEGVRCGDAEGRVTILDLGDCGFESASLHPALFDLTSLTHLNLAWNSFNGSELPTHGFERLKSFADLISLSVLRLTHNLLEGWFPTGIFQNHNLTAIDISYNFDVSGSLPDFLSHGALIEMLVSNTNFSGSIPGSIRNLKSLNKLGVAVGDSSQVLPSSIAIVDLSFNQFKGPIPTPGPNIQLLDCSNNQFSSMPLKFASQLIRFSYFKASGNNLSGNIPSSICEATRLVLIDLSYNNLSGSIPSCLMADINYLSVLNLKSNRLQGVLPHNAQHGCGLEALDFSDNWIEGKIPRSLSACRELEVFDIGKNSITDTFPCWMSTLPKLQVLVLKSNKFIGNIGPSVLGDGDICRFPKLRILSVSFNNLSGTLSNEWFKSMKSMITESTNETLVMGKQQNLDGHTYQLTTTITFKGFDITKILRTIVVIDVSCNAFHGVIPLSIGDLVLLNGLVMSHNDFTGQIPSQISALRQLEVLRLSSNHLSGEIPQTLASMNFLSVLNLSYNDLVGRIPESPQFLTFSNLSFLGNVGLCGLQVGKACHNNTPPQYHLQEKSVDVILFIVIGIGFGVGFVVAVVLGSCKWCIKIG